MKTSLVVLLTLLVPTLAGADCDPSLVGKTYKVGSGVSLTNLAKRPDEPVGDEMIQYGQSFMVTSYSDTRGFSGKYTLITHDARQLYIACTAMSSDLSLGSALATMGVRAAPDEDFSEAIAAAKVQQAAGEQAARRRRQAAHATEEKSQREAREYEAQRMARGGVHVGMTEAEARNSSWGPPRTVNHDISASGHREQWVYEDNHYLYFADGVLTTVQTDNSGFFRAGQ